MTAKIGNLAFYGVASAFLVCSTASAGLLASNAAAVFDSGGALASGSFSATDSAAGAVLDVTIDYAVFKAADFDSLFPSSGYTPTGKLVYTYQVFVNDPSSTIGVNTQLVLPIISTTDAAPGTFNTVALGGIQAPAAASFSGPVGNQVATWNFGDFSPFGPDFTIDPGESSFGLAFSSDNAPVFNFQGGRAESLGGGLQAVVPVHVPGPDPFVHIPEPGTLALLGLCVAAYAARRRGC